MAIVTFADLASIRTRHVREKIVFCSGGFDFTHIAHALFLQDCKKQGDVLVVMVARDTSRMRDKKDRQTLFNEQARLAMIDFLKPVDYSFLEGKVPDNVKPLHCLDRVFESLRPDVYVINDDAYDISYRQKLARSFDVELVIGQRHLQFGDISTTWIIDRVWESQKGV